MDLSIDELRVVAGVVAAIMRAADQQLEHVPDDLRAVILGSVALSAARTLQAHGAKSTLRQVSDGIAQLRKGKVPTTNGFRDLGLAGREPIQ